jgi:hypothetical protein
MNFCIGDNPSPYLGDSIDLTGDFDKAGNKDALS